MTDPDTDSQPSFPRFSNGIEEVRIFEDELDDKSLISKFAQRKYNVMEFVLLCLSMWIPILLLTAMAMSFAEPEFSFKEATLYVTSQFLGIGYHSHPTSTVAIGLAIFFGTSLLPLSMFTAITYTIFWDTVASKLFPCLSHWLQLLAVWGLSIVANLFILPRESGLELAYAMYNIYTTNGSTIAISEIQWYSIIFTVHSSLIYVGTLYICMDAMMQKSEIKAASAVDAIRKTMMKKQIIESLSNMSRNEMVELSNDILETSQTDPKLHEMIKTLSQTMSRSHSFKSSFILSRNPSIVVQLHDSSRKSKRFSNQSLNLIPEGKQLEQKYSSKTGIDFGAKKEKKAEIPIHN